MKKIRNQAVLKYNGKTKLSNIVEADMMEITDFCECINDCIKVTYIPDEKKTYTYSLTPECDDPASEKKRKSSI